MYGFNHASWSNWSALRTFFSINPWFNACFNLRFLCVQDSFLCQICYKQIYCIFQLFFFQLKMADIYENGINILDIWLLLLEYILIYCFCHNFLWSLHQIQITSPPIQKHLRVNFEILPTHKDYLHLNTWDMIIQYFLS